MKMPWIYLKTKYRLVPRHFGHDTKLSNVEGIKMLYLYVIIASDSSNDMSLWALFGPGLRYKLILKLKLKQQLAATVTFSLSENTLESAQHSLECTKASAAANIKMSPQSKKVW